MITTSMIPVTTLNVFEIAVPADASELSALSTPRPANTQVTMRAQFLPLPTWSASSTVEHQEDQADDEGDGADHPDLVVDLARLRPEFESRRASRRALSELNSTIAE